MSYTLVYDKKFLKTKNGYITLVLAGSSNCYNVRYDGREVRERSWCAFNYAEQPKSEADIMAMVHSELPSTYGQHFMYNGKWVNDKGLVNFVQSGIKNALTLEELIGKYLVFGLHVSVTAKDLTSDKEFKPSITLMTKYCKTNEELEEALAEAEAAIKSQSKDAYPYVNYSFGFEKTRLETRHKKSRRRSKPSAMKAGAYIRLKNGDYFTRKSSRHMWFSYYVESARLFNNAEAAEKYCREELRGYDTANGATIVARKLVIRTVSDKPHVPTYWAGRGFVSDKNFAHTFNTEAQAEKEMRSPVFAEMSKDFDVKIDIECFEVATVTREPANT